MVASTMFVVSPINKAAARSAILVFNCGGRTSTGNDHSDYRSRFTCRSSVSPPMADVVGGLEGEGNHLQIRVVAGQRGSTEAAFGGGDGSQQWQQRGGGRCRVASDSSSAASFPLRLAAHDEEYEGGGESLVVVKNCGGRRVMTTTRSGGRGWQRLLRQPLAVVSRFLLDENDERRIWEGDRGSE
ncbi:unnamed protein product [Lactuca virosa]|uniref:Uncharacterized protein n=1 Tax=Lactuca virosa TaxID=75947 RepID=A0AAU9M061_9ASTR|nr:unnamed protein product [Lactuca virosa]